MKNSCGRWAVFLIISLGGVGSISLIFSGFWGVLFILL